jgi:hypothetical protein
LGDEEAVVEQRPHRDLKISQFPIDDPWAQARQVWDTPTGSRPANTYVEALGKNESRKENQAR